MTRDPITFLVPYLRGCLAELPHGAVVGDMTGREPGDITVYLAHSGGYRAIRSRLDRADVEYEVYAPDREAAAGLAYRVRELLLEDLPGRDAAGVLVLDVADVDSPKYLPDSTSREHCYGGEVAVSYIEE
ncbi:hypothetical protein SMD11_1248 [Streptomyces albireticuli]|uniref:DUF3168 domain-containing protein n=1 Tax=Streptomyces albireticuli TaxID=1940 RepID=A0A1Z2KY02_9ACTN|nr:hypothetical protein [Streptomyces albireticuli]ARZ66909.1 hypothetical protein SMD11_1248 [Streptomyces albireticuli]